MGGLVFLYFHPKQEEYSEKVEDNLEIEEIDFHLEEIPANDTIQIKQRNDVYYKMYKEAKQNAKIARDLALSSYLEVKRIKNTYMLTDIDSDSDEEIKLPRSKK